ncbi:molybdenum cofactor biosynthesis protein A [Gimesia panareensis]|uniref:Molybdenum cofactor biosynthesis protein A n=1 Tax=Gimesia panareensis TaxID=2527978 RepID=A0A517QC51_9PLAN|nr:radical SAM protein [Gimesia panareensis]QDT29165.1 molybdenum cofactor biosynthesis protein A [Gimesia panareensis]
MTTLVQLNQSKPRATQLQPRYHVTVLSNFARGYDKYARDYSKARISESRFTDKFHLLELDQLQIGIEKNNRLLKKLNLPDNQLLVLETFVDPDQLQVTEQTGLGHYIQREAIRLQRVYLVDRDLTLHEISLEEAMARSLSILQRNLSDFSELTPRSVSLLPVAIGCQAKCSFCFSKSSASTDQEKGTLSPEYINTILQTAKARGAQRAVITGGGEPTLYPRAKLLELIRLAANWFPEKVVLITNGYLLTEMSTTERLAFLEELQAVGLTTLAISHHHYDSAVNRRIMNLEIDIAKISKCLTGQPDRFPSLSMRLICVLQKAGIESQSAIRNYLDWAASLKIREVCFKELYVSTSVESVYFSRPANEWSEAHQVPLQLLLDYFQQEQWVRIGELPWGAPIYTGMIKGVPMKVAAYTEPSLLWELNQGLCRSWNIMADGRCLTSLEDRRSEIQIV